MKMEKKIIKFLILAVTERNLDPIQFAYWSGRGVDDTKLFILNTLYRHLEGPQTHARILFADFSSAFNTIQPHILANKLASHFSLDNHWVLWITDFLTNRLQRVFVNGCFSELTCWVSSGVCPVSTSLYSIYRRLPKQPLKWVSGKICRRHCSTITTSAIWAVPSTCLNWDCWLVQQLLFRSKCE